MVFFFLFCVQHIYGVAYNLSRNNSFGNYIYKLENNFYLPFIKKVVLKMIEPLIIQNDMQVFH